MSRDAAAGSSAPFPYMRWAKRHLTGFSGMNLGMSGVPGLTAADVPFDREIGWWAPEGEYGDPALRALLAAHLGVPPEHLFVSAGASLANFLVYLSEARGGHVAVETPAYEALLRLPAAVGATVSTFARVEASGWRLDPASVRAAVRPGTKLLVVTDLHNPSGTRLHPDDLRLLVAEAERVDAVLLVDEVYLELDLERRTSAATLGPRVVVTNSLTKAHGLGGLRIGWIVAAPDRIERIAGWNDLVCPAHPVPSIAVAKAYLPRAAAFLERTRAVVADRLDRADAWVRARGDVSWTRPHGGITGFLRLPPGLDADRLSEHAQAKRGLSLVPGSFFQAPDHVRLSYGLPVPDLERALTALGSCLDDLRPVRPR